MKAMFTRITQRLAYERDFTNWSRSLGQVPKPEGSKVVLLADLVSSLASYKAQALFARALIPHGYRPVVLLHGRNKVAERFYNAAQSTRFIYLDDFIKNDFIDQARELLDTPDAFDRLLTLEIDGIRIGRNVLSLVLRRLRTGRLVTGNSQQLALAVEILAQSLAAKAAGEIVLDHVKPSLAIFNERGYTPAGELFDLCVMRGIDTIQWLGAPQADRLLFKRYTLANRASHPLALDPVTWNHLQAKPLDSTSREEIMTQLASHYGSGAWFNRQQLQTDKNLMEPEEVRQVLGVSSGRKIAVIFCHILYDATFFYGSSLFKDYEEWLVETVRSAIANPHLDWIIKVHPVNVWRSRMDGQPMEQLESIALHRAFGELPPHIRIMPADTSINTWSLFQTIDYSLTVRGTVGMETPCFGIPTVTAGTGRYSGHGFTIDPENQAQYRDILARLHTIPRLDDETIAKARLYAWGTFFRRPIPTYSFRLDFQGQGRHPSLVPNCDILSPPDQAADLAALAQWIATSRDADFLSEFP